MLEISEEWKHKINFKFSNPCSLKDNETEIIWPTSGRFDNTVGKENWLKFPPHVQWFHVTPSVNDVVSCCELCRQAGTSLSFQGSQLEVPRGISVRHQPWPRSRGCHSHLGVTSLLVTGYWKMCLHFQNSGVCVSDYVANPLIFDLDTKNIWVWRFCTRRYI